MKINLGQQREMVETQGPLKPSLMLFPKCFQMKAIPGFFLKYMISAIGQKDYMDSFHGTKRLAGKKHSVLTAPDTAVSTTSLHPCPQLLVGFQRKGPSRGCCFPSSCVSGTTSQDG